MKSRTWMLGVAWLLAAAGAQASYIDHNFDAAPFVSGTNFLAPGISNWVASTSSVVVVNTKSFSGPNSVYLPESSAISNAVLQSPTTVWTDFRLAPMLGEPPESSTATNGASFVCYLSSNGYVTVWGGSGWLTCSNDVWNNPVTKVTNGVFATLSIYQNYSAKRFALMVNDRVVAQDLPFAAPNATNYGYFVVQNTHSNAWLDDAWVQTSVETGRHTYSGNNTCDPLPDATELQTWGYVARTFYVGATRPYNTLTDALAVARDRDRIEVDCGVAAYTDTATITANVTIAGCAFTNSGTLTVQAGKTVTVASGFTSPLTVNGTLALAGGVTVNGSLVTVAGSGQITGVGTGAQLLAGDLDITGSGQVVVTGGRVSDTAALVDMTGTFTLNSTWGSAVTASLDFIEDFERYADGQRLDKLGFAAWGASASNALVQAGKGYSGKGALIAEGSLISNRLSTAVGQKIWTDFRLQPMPGDMPITVDTNNTGFVCYVSSNGLLNVWSGTAGTWLACSNYFNGSNVTAMTSNSYPRLTVFANFTSKKTAVFVDGKLCRELIGFGLNTLPSYTSFQAQNTDGNAWFDDLRITTGIPADLQVVNANTDLDNDGMADAAEIQLYESLLVWNGPPVGTLFWFR